MKFFCSDDKNARSGIVSLGGARCISVLSAFMRLHNEGVLLKEDAEPYLQAYLSECRKHNQTTFIGIATFINLFLPVDNFTVVF